MVDKSSNAVELDSESSISVSGVASAVAITGLVIGASCYMMNKKRSDAKTDIETSLIEK